MTTVGTRRAWLMPAILAWGMLGLPGTMWAAISALAVNPLFAAIPIVYFAVLIGMAYALPQWVKHRSGALRADETGLFLDGKRLVERSAISYGHVVRERGKQLLRLVMRGRNDLPIDIEVADEAQATALLEALYLDQTIAEYRFAAGRYRASLAQAAYVALGSVGAGGGLLVLMDKLAFHESAFVYGTLALVAFIFSGAVMTAVSQEHRLVVGLDGVWIHRRLVEKRFVPFREIVSIEGSGKDVVLKLADHTVHECHHGPNREEDAPSLIAKVRAGIAASRETPANAGDAVARKGRTVTDWIASAAKTHERAANYRAPVVPQDDLWRIVEDASASATERAGAALALRAELSDEGKTRLRIAAGTCAEEKLRVALESVTQDDETLAAALEPLEDAAPAQRALRRL